MLDESGAAAAGTSLIARNIDTGFERSAVADPKGRCRLSLLPLGRYELIAEARGFARLRRGGLELSVGQTLNLRLALKIAGVAESVDVTAEAPLVETARSLSANTVDTRAMESLPINGRRFQDFVLLTPGALERQTGFTVIGGQRGVNAAFTIDGADYDGPFFGGIRGGERAGLAYTISQEAIQEFQVTNAGYGAEFGRSGGGVVNAVTRSGTNELHGSAFWYFRNEALMAKDPFGRPPTDFQQHQFGASLGGPIRKDKAHFFLAYDQQVHDNPFVVKFQSNPAGIPGFEGQEGTYTQTNDIVTALARLDLRLGERHRLSVRYNFSHNRAQNGLSTSPTDQTVAAGALERDTIHTAVAELNSVFAGGRLNTLRLQWSREDRPREPNTLAPTVMVAGLGTTGRVFFMPALESDDRFQLMDSFTLPRGSHSLRFGTDVNLTHTQQSFFLPLAGGLYFFDSVASYLDAVLRGEQGWTVFFQGFGRPDVSFWQKEIAFYAQDHWRARANLTINYGLRWEAQIEPQPDTPNPALPGSDRIPSDGKQIGPRLGLAWDPWKDSRGVVRVNAGLFYSRTPGLLLAGPFTLNGRRQIQLGFTPDTPGAALFPAILSAPPVGAEAPPPDADVFAPGFCNPRTFQASVGIEREVWPSLSLSVDLAHARMRRLERLRDVNIFPASGTAPDGRLLYPSERPNQSFNLIRQRESTARGAYTAVTLGAKKRWTSGERWFHRGLQFQAFYTYARSKDDDSNERDSFGVFYQDWQNLAAEYAWSNNDVRHRFVMNGTWSLAGSVQFGVIFVARGGFPYSHTSFNDLNNDGTFGNDRQFIAGRDTGRNAYRQPGYSRLDLRLAKLVGLGGRRSLEVALDLFNALNARNLVVPAQNQTFDGIQPGSVNPSLDRPEAQDGAPRSGQVSVRLRF